MTNDHHQLSYSVKYKKCPNVYIVITQKSENPYIGHRLYPCRKIRVTHERISYTKLVTGKSRGSIIKDFSAQLHALTETKMSYSLLNTALFLKKIIYEQNKNK